MRSPSLSAPYRKVALSLTVIPVFPGAGDGVDVMLFAPLVKKAEKQVDDVNVCEKVKEMAGVQEGTQAMHDEEVGALDALIEDACDGEVFTEDMGHNSV